MPRDENGNYTLPAGNPVQTDTLITSDWANSTMQDLAAEMTDSLSRQGKGALTGPFQIIDEQGGIPGLAFINEPTSGVKRSASGDIRMQVLGGDRMRWRAGNDKIPEVQVNAVWKDVALVEANRKAMQGVPGETTIWFYNNTVPAAAGWSLVSLDSNFRSLMIGGAGGSYAGTQDPTSDTLSVSTTVTVNLPATTGAHTLTTAEIPAHNHQQRARPEAGGATFGTGGVSSDATASNSAEYTVNEGGGGSHTHPIGGTAAGTGTGTTSAYTPRYAMGVMGRMDA